MVYFQQSLFGKMSWERFHQMTGWILEPSYPLSQTPMFQCLLLEDGQEPEWCEGERLTSAGGSWTPSIGQAPGWHDGSVSFLWQTLDLDYWIFFKWIFKTACAILILSNTFNIVMAVFDVSQSVIARAAGIVQGSTDISEAMLADLEATLETLGLGSLLGLWLQSLLIHVTMWAINIVIFVIVYGRMIEIYLLTSLAPIPVATLSNRELGNTGQNYLKSLFAVGFQGLLILVCVAIYAVLIQGIATSGDPIGAIWGCMGYSVLLCFCLFKTGSIARSVFSAH